MKSVAIFEDGKIRRGSSAKLIKRGNKRVLIEFQSYNFKTGEDDVCVEWFTLFIPWYVNNKKLFKHNNKRKSAMYIHKNTNEFYSDRYQSEYFRREILLNYGQEYYEEIYGDK